METKAALILPKITQLVSGVTLGKIPHFSEPQFPHLYNVVNTVVYLGIVEIKWGNVHST